MGSKMNPRELVNNRSSSIWLKCNDNSRSSYFRSRFVDEFGGEFVNMVVGDRAENEWVWKDNIIEPQETLINNEEFNNSAERLYEITYPDGNKVVVENLAQFAKENDLRIDGLYRCSGKNAKGMNSKYKGFRCIKLKG